MNDREKFEQLWNDYLEGELPEGADQDLDRLSTAKDDLSTVAVDSYQVHRLLGLKAQDSDLRHESFVNSTMERVLVKEQRVAPLVTGQMPKSVGASVRLKSISFALLATTILVLIASPFFQASGDKEMARVTGLRGLVHWTGEGGVVSQLKRQGQVVGGGTLEIRSADAWAELTYFDGTVVTVSGSAAMSLSDEQQKVINLRHGLLSADVTEQPVNRPMLVVTPTAKLNVLGTQFNVDAQSESTRLVVNEGLVRMTRSSDGQVVDVDAQHSVVTSVDEDESLAPVPRAQTVTAWVSDLEHDVVRGKWVSAMWSLGLELKEAVSKGELTKAEAIRSYKGAANLDDSAGGIWAVPSPFGSLVVLSPRRSMEQSLVVSDSTQVLVRGRAFSEVSCTIGLSLGEVNGGFSGKYRKEMMLSGTGEEFSFSIPISDFIEDGEVDSTAAGKELIDWWCIGKSRGSKLEITAVELKASPEIEASQ